MATFGKGCCIVHKVFNPVLKHRITTSCVRCIGGPSLLIKSLCVCSDMPFFRFPAWMKYRQNQHIFFLNSIKHTVRKSLQRPTPDRKLQFLHGKRLLRDECSGCLNCSLKPSSQLRMNRTVTRFFLANIFTGRRQEPNRLQSSSARKSEKTSSAE